MELYVRVEVHLHSFLTSTLHGDKWVIRTGLPKNMFQRARSDVLSAVLQEIQVFLGRDAV